MVKESTCERYRMSPAIMEKHALEQIIIAMPKGYWCFFVMASLVYY
jgi:hypothetical protein